MVYTVKCMWDDEAQVWIADSDDISGLVLESDSLDALKECVKNAAVELVELNKLPRNYIIRFGLF